MATAYEDKEIRHVIQHPGPPTRLSIHFGAGHANDFPVLPRKAFTYHPELLAEARIVAASVLDAEGLWTERTDDMQLHFLLHDLTLLDTAA